MSSMDIDALPRQIKVEPGVGIEEYGEQAGMAKKTTQTRLQFAFMKNMKREIQTRDEEIRRQSREIESLQQRVEELEKQATLDRAALRDSAEVSSQPKQQALGIHRPIHRFFPVHNENTPASERIPNLDLDQPFAEAFREVGSREMGKIIFVERNAIEKTITRDGEAKVYRARRLLQEVGLEVVGERLETRYMIGGRTFNQYNVNGQVNLWQRFGKSCLVMHGDREMLCRELLVEALD